MVKSKYAVEKIRSDDELEQIVELIQGYQNFYLDKFLDKKSILEHFRQLISPSEKGFLLAARDQGKPPVGFCTVYFLPSSLSCRNYACFNDLYVSNEVRGQGIGRSLIQTASEVGKEFGFDTIEWITKKDNLAAQKLYDKLTSNKSLWYYYSLKAD